MKKITNANREAIKKHLLACRGLMTQEQAGAIIGLSRSSVASFCCKWGITGWPQGAAAPKDQSGERNPNFKGGMSRATISRITKRVLSEHGRDLFTCERCGRKRKIELPRHHKDRDRTNNDITNLEVICVPCHNKEHMPERSRDSLGRLLCNTK